MTFRFTIESTENLYNYTLISEINISAPNIKTALKQLPDYIKALKLDK